MPVNWNDSSSTLGDCHSACEEYRRQGRTGCHSLSRTGESSGVCPSVASAIIGGEERQLFLLPDECSGTAGPSPRSGFDEDPSGTIYYYPRSEEDMETAEVIVPALETLMIVDGTLERPVRHIRVEGITFAHTSWMRPSYQGHVTLQGGFPLLDAYKTA